MTRPILIVDDDASLRTLIALLLEEENIPFLTASDGQEALDVIQQEPPRLVLLDLQMPVLDGAGVVQRLQHWGMDIPVVLMSAEPSLASRGRELGITHLLPKPFELNNLLSTIGRALVDIGESIGYSQASISRPPS